MQTGDNNINMLFISPGLAGEQVVNMRADVRRRKNGVYLRPVNCLLWHYGHIGCDRVLDDGIAAGLHNLHNTIGPICIGTR